MEHQDQHSKSDPLQDFSILHHRGPNFDKIALSDQSIDHRTSKTELRGLNKHYTGVGMSAEELKIRNELEMEVERDLEEEIKDGIYHLVLRLHRLYQHQKERSARETGDQQHGVKNKTLSEVNINIRLDGGTKLEIKEMKKEGSDSQSGHGRPQISRSQTNVKQGLGGPNGKRFDWVKTLRSGAGPVAINKRNESSDHAPQCLKMDNARRNCNTASGQLRGNVRVDNKLLKLGWRD